MWMFGSRTTVKKVRNSLTWFSHLAVMASAAFNVCFIAFFVAGAACSDSVLAVFVAGAAFGHSTLAFFASVGGAIVSSRKNAPLHVFSLEWRLQRFVFRGKCLRSVGC